VSSHQAFADVHAALLFVAVILPALRDIAAELKKSKMYRLPHNRA
jgi:hypothetical protein